MNTQLPRDPQEKFEQEARVSRPGLEVDKDYVRPEMQTALSKSPLAAAYKRTASNFYWIAGLSLVNTGISIFGGDLYFPVGLGLTQIVDGFAWALNQEIPEARLFVMGINLFVNAVVCGLIVLFGYLVSRGHDWPLLIGMALYALDGVVMLLFQDWIGAGFHAYFLFLIWSGYSVIRQWKKRQAQGQDSFPQNIGVS